MSLVQGKIQYYRDYVNDLREKAMAARNEVNRTEVIQGINGTNARQGKLKGVGVWTDEHCERMIISERVD